MRSQFLNSKHSFLPVKTTVDPNLQSFNLNWDWLTLRSPVLIVKLVVGPVETTQDPQFQPINLTWDG